MTPPLGFARRARDPTFTIKLDNAEFTINTHYKKTILEILTVFDGYSEGEK
jgi:hypothetical protein